MEETNQQTKRGKILMIVTLVYYVLAVVLGLIGYFAFSGLVRAYSFVILIMACSVFYYFATQKQLKIPKAVRIVLFLAGVASMAVLSIVYTQVVLMKQMTDFDSQVQGFGAIILQACPIIGMIGSFLLYLIAACTSPQKARGKARGFVTRVLCSDVFPLLLAIGLTVFLIPISCLLILAFFVLLLLWFFGTVKGSKGGSSSDTTVYTVYDGGFTRELRYYGRYNGHDRFRDDLGYFWYSDDGGNTFYKE